MRLAVTTWFPATLSLLPSPDVAAINSVLMFRFQFRAGTFFYFIKYICDSVAKYWLGSPLTPYWIAWQKIKQISEKGGINTDPAIDTKFSVTNWVQINTCLFVSLLWKTHIMLIYGEKEGVHITETRLYYKIGWHVFFDEVV